MFRLGYWLGLKRRRCCYGKMGQLFRLVNDNKYRGMTISRYVFFHDVRYANGWRFPCLMSRFLRGKTTLSMKAHTTMNMCVFNVVSEFQ